MISIRTVADIAADRQVIVTLPPETPIGRAELTITVLPQSPDATSHGNFRKRFGAFHSGTCDSANAEQIDAELQRSYHEGTA